MLVLDVGDAVATGAAEGAADAVLLAVIPGFGNDGSTGLGALVAAGADDGAVSGAAAAGGTGSARGGVASLATGVVVGEADAAGACFEVTSQVTTPPAKRSIAAAPAMTGAREPRGLLARVSPQAISVLLAGLDRTADAAGTPLDCEAGDIGSVMLAALGVGATARPPTVLAIRSTERRAWGGANGKRSCASSATL